MALERPADIHRRISLRNRFQFQLPPTTRDSFGERESGTWVSQFETRGRLRPMRGTVFTEGQSINTEFTHNITLRYRAGVQSGMRAVTLNVAGKVDSASRTFDVRIVDDVQSKARWLTLRCVEIPAGATA